VSLSPIAAVNHIALMTPDLDRLAGFYESVFGAEVLARAEGEPRKCFIRLNEFVLAARDPGAFVAIRDGAVRAARNSASPGP